MTNFQKQIYYSEKYCDENYEYRCKFPDLIKKLSDKETLFSSEIKHVVLPKEIAKLVPKNKLMSESEWRGIGVQQSQGWIHYMKHDPEPHILLFRRPLPNENGSAQ